MTIGDIVDHMTEEQKCVLYSLVDVYLTLSKEDSVTVTNARRMIFVCNAMADVPFFRIYRTFNQDEINATMFICNKALKGG